MMNSAIQKYLVMHALKDIRRGQPLEDELAEALNLYPLVDSLTAAATAEDISRLVGMCRSAATTASVWSLALSMLRNFDTRPEIKAFLLEEWTRTEENNKRMVLAWRILDDGQLVRQVHVQIYGFVKANIERFVVD